MNEIAESTAVVPSHVEAPTLSLLPLILFGIVLIVVFWKISQTPYQSDGVPRSRLTYILLALFAGIFGLHDFYAGYKFRGMLALLLTLTFFGMFISAIMALYDIVNVTHDASGVKMKEYGE